MQEEIYSKNSDTLTKTIQDKAREMKITPKLLLISLGALHFEDNDSGAILKYIQALSEDMRDTAIRQCKSKNKNSREAGEYAFTNSEDPFDKWTDKPVTGYLSASNYFDPNHPIKHYVRLAWYSTVKDIQGLQKRYLSNYGPDTGFLTIIKNNCGEELLKLKAEAKLFEENDICHN